MERGVKAPKTVDNPVETVYNMLYIRRFIQKLQKKLNIKPEECVAFGDYLNDYEMMQSVYYSYAMENAIPELKKVARYIAPPNYKNGVVKTIRQLLAQQESNH